MKTVKAYTGKLMYKVKHAKRSHVTAAALISAFAVLGVVAISLSNAATSLVSSEAEAGTLAGNAAQVSNVAGASGGRGVQFKAAGSTPNPTPPTPTPSPGGVPAISRDGSKLIRDGKQYKFAGLNADGFGLNDCRKGEEGGNMTDANIDQYFRELNPHSVTRIWPYDGAGNIQLMDRIVTAAEKYGQYLAPAFFDGNDQQCGSEPNGNVSASLSHIKPIIERYAKDTGARKTNVIAFWEISNEIGINDKRDWFNGVAKGMKQMDPKTLVGTGLSAYFPSNNTETMTQGHSSPDIDLISIHEYDDGCNVSGQASKAIGAAKNLNKPWYSGESGGKSNYSNGNASDAACLKKEWQAYIDEPECAGMLYWDFKMLRNASGDTMTILEPNELWGSAKSFRHQYQGV